jgi:hypothetical protein
MLERQRPRRPQISISGGRAPSASRPSFGLGFTVCDPSPSREILRGRCRRRMWTSFGNGCRVEHPRRAVEATAVEDRPPVEPEVGLDRWIRYAVEPLGELGRGAVIELGHGSLTEAGGRRRTYPRSRRGTRLSERGDEHFEGWTARRTPRQLLNCSPSSLLSMRALDRLRAPELPDRLRAPSGR